MTSDNDLQQPQITSRGTGPSGNRWVQLSMPLLLMVDKLPPDATDREVIEFAIHEYSSMEFLDYNPDNRGSRTRAVIDSPPSEAE